MSTLWKMSGGTCLSSFSSSSSLYGDISSDGCCKLWKTQGGVADVGSSPLHEYRPPLHLASPLSSFTWIKLRLTEASDVSSRHESSKPKGKKRKSSLSDKVNHQNEDAADCIAFGTTSGKVLVYSPSLGRVEAELNPAGGKSSAVRCIDWNEGTGLITCSADNVITEWNVTEGIASDSFDLAKRDKTYSAEKTNCIKICDVVNKKLLLTATCQIRLWCLTKKIVLRKIIGHSNDVCHLDYVYFKNSEKLYVLSGSKNDRILSFWSVDLPTDDHLHNGTSNSSKKKRNRTKSQTTSDDEDFKNETVSTPCCSFLMEDVAKKISCKSEPDRNTSVKLLAITRSGVGHYYEHTLNGLSTKPVKPNTTIQVACEMQGGNVRPVPLICGTIQNQSLVFGYSLDVGMIFETINPDINEKTHILIKKMPQKSKQASINNINENITKIKQGKGNESKVVYLTSTTEMETNELKRPLGGKPIDVPMESRLANLSIAKSGDKNLPDTKNMAHLLVQALHSKDSKFLQTVFECKDPEVAFNSVNKLPIQYIQPLLDHLTSMLGGKTNICKSACVWGTALCQARSSVLLGQMESTGALLAALGARRPALPHLLALRARLALTSQQEKVSNIEDSASNPLLTYNDSSSEDEIDEDMEDMIIHNNEDDSASWNEDDDDDDEDEDNSSKASNQDHDMSD